MTPSRVEFTAEERLRRELRQRGEEWPATPAAPDSSEEHAAALEEELRRREAEGVELRRQLADAEGKASEREKGLNEEIEGLVYELAQANGKTEEVRKESKREKDLISALLEQRDRENAKMHLIVDSYEKSYHDTQMHPGVVEQRRQNDARMALLENELKEREKLAQTKQADTDRQIDHLEKLLIQKQSAPPPPQHTRASPRRPTLPDWCILACIRAKMAPTRRLV